MAGRGATEATAGARGAGRRRASGGMHASDIFSARHGLIVATALLVAYGLVMTYSVTSVTTVSTAQESAGVVSQFLSVSRDMLVQLGATVLGGLAAFGISRLDVERILNPVFVGVLWLVTVALMLFTAAAGGNAYGATRWLYIGSLSVQPSEFAKIAMVILCSRVMYEYFELRMRELRRVSVLYVLPVLVLMLSIYLQKDMGTLVIMALGIYCMLIVAGCRKRYLLGLAAVGAVLAIVLVSTEGYRMGRLASWRGDVFNDSALSSGEGYQLKQGLYALGTGGFFGTGLGTSRLKYGYLTQADNDFIFDVIGEELGFLFGTLPIILLFCLFGFCGLRIAAKAGDSRGRLLAGGMTSMLLIQAFINIGGVIKLIPETGRTLPFVSSGNSSLIASLLMVGCILAVDRKQTWSSNERRARRARRGFGVIEGGTRGGEAELRAPDVELGAVAPGGQRRRERPGGEAGGRRPARAEAPTGARSVRGVEPRRPGMPTSPEYDEPGLARPRMRDASGGERPHPSSRGAADAVRAQGRPDAGARGGSGTTRRASTPAPGRERGTARPTRGTGTADRDVRGRGTSPARDGRTGAPTARGGSAGGGTTRLTNTIRDASDRDRRRGADSDERGSR
ncbi:MAG: FtsW/RodA/SpoVE family cell cycle protein [Coriobacteriales bacterium]|jgi:cell division protein FtsW